MNKNPPIKLRTGSFWTFCLWRESRWRWAKSRKLEYLKKAELKVERLKILRKLSKEWKIQSDSKLTKNEFNKVKCTLNETKLYHENYRRYSHCRDSSTFLLAYRLHALIIKIRHILVGSNKDRSNHLRTFHYQVK